MLAARGWLVRPHRLRTRLSQNGVEEKLTRQWIDRCLRHIGAREELVAR